MHVACSLQLKTHRLQKPVKCERSKNLTTNILKSKLMLHQRPIAHRTAEDGKDDRYSTRE
jgi:hypothetical protein